MKIDMAQEAFHAIGPESYNPSMQINSQLSQVLSSLDRNFGALQMADQTIRCLFLNSGLWRKSPFAGEPPDG